MCPSAWYNVIPLAEKEVKCSIVLRMLCVLKMYTHVHIRMYVCNCVSACVCMYIR